MADEIYHVDRGVVMAAMNFIRAMKGAYGEKRGVKAWEAISEELGEDIAAAVFFGILSGDIGKKIKITDHGGKKINVIKEIRTHVGLSLYDAKNASEGKCLIDIDELSQMKYDKLMEAFREYNVKYEFGD